MRRDASSSSPTSTPTKGVDHFGAGSGRQPHLPYRRLGQLHRGSWTHLLSFKQPLVAGQAPYDGAGNNRHGALRTRGTTSLNWAVGDWSSTLSLQYVSGYDQRVATATSNPGLRDRIKPYHQLDLYVARRYCQHHAVAVGAEPDRQGPAVRPRRWLQRFRHQPANCLRGQFVSLGARYRF